MARALEALEQLQGGADWEDIAREYGTDTTSQAAPSSATLPAAVAPSATSGAIASGRRSNTCSPSGQSTSRPAIGAPICPSPTNPTVTPTPGSVARGVHMADATRHRSGGGRS